MPTIERRPGPCPAQLKTPGTTLILQEIEPDQAGSLRPGVGLYVQFTDPAGVRHELLDFADEGAS